MRTIFILILFGCFYSELYAQGKFGVQAAALISKNDYDKDFAAGFDNEYQVGYSVNLFLERRYTPVFGLSFEPGYLVKGDQIVVKTADQSAKLQSTVSYVNLPVQANLHFLNIIAISAGPEFSVKLNEGFEGDFNSDPEEELKDMYNDVEVGGMLGFYLSPLPKVKFGLRYTFALSNSIKFENGSFEQSGAMSDVIGKSKSIQILLRIVFN
ncbi:MAG: porin family protein [Luteibaculum sp.]